MTSPPAYATTGRDSTAACAPYGKGDVLVGWNPQQAAHRRRVRHLRQIRRQLFDRRREHAAAIRHGPEHSTRGRSGAPLRLGSTVRIEVRRRHWTSQNSPPYTDSVKGHRLKPRASSQATRIVPSHAHPSQATRIRLKPRASVLEATRIRRRRPAAASTPRRRSSRSRRGRERPERGRIATSDAHAYGLRGLRRGVSPPRPSEGRRGLRLVAPAKGPP